MTAPDPPDFSNLTAMRPFRVGDWLIQPSLNRMTTNGDAVHVEPRIVRVRALAGLGQAYMLNARHRDARPMLEAAIDGAQAMLRPGESMRFGGFELSLDELRKWGEFQVIRWLDVIREREAARKAVANPNLEAA